MKTDRRGKIYDYAELDFFGEFLFLTMVFIWALTGLC
jgi:hypothetical protein